jgi:hypothetical protein
VTSHALTTLLGRLAATTDDTQTVRVLAPAELSKDNAFYYAHLDSAERLTPALRQVNWQVLDDFSSAGDTAEGDAEASLITAALRQAARRDEHEMALAAPLRKAAEDAITLLREQARRSAQVPRASGEGTGSPAIGQPAAATGRGTGSSVIVPGAVAPVAGPESGPTPPLSPPTPPVGERIRAKDVPAFVERICEAADEHPDAEFEIAWRIVER